MTKCYFLVHDDPTVSVHSSHEFNNTRDYSNHFGLSRAAIFNAVEASLKRLDTPYIDLYQIHRLDENVPFEEIMKALHDLVQSGKVRYIGASSMHAWQFAELQHIAEKNGWTKFVSMQNEYSLLYREEVSLSTHASMSNFLSVTSFTGTGNDPLLCTPWYRSSAMVAPGRRLSCSPIWHDDNPHGKLEHEHFRSRQSDHQTR